MYKKILIFILSLFTTEIYGQWNKIYSASDIITFVITDSSTVHYSNYNNNYIYTSINGGINFDSTNSPINGNISFFDIDFPSKDTGYACGGAPFSPYEVIIKTTNGGITWDSITSNIHGDNAFRKMQFVTNEIGYFQGSKEPMITINGGTSLSDIINLNQYRSVDDFNFLTSQTGFIAIHKSSNFGVPIEINLLKTTDYGNNWSIIYKDTLKNNKLKFITKIQFIDTLVGYASVSEFIPYGGSGGTHILKGVELMKTIDGGSSWLSDTLVSLDSNTTNNGLSDMHFFNSDTGYICVRGKIFKTNNSGTTWINQPIQNNDEINKFQFYNNQIAYAFGDNGIYKTINGGDYPLNANKILDNKSIKISPNPVTDFLVIKPKLTNSSYKLFNSIGQVLKQESNIEINTIDFSAFKSGNYYLQIINKKNNYTFKIQKN
jgi:photosystem II stability/assembly factor-like uncharacterized protein